MNAYSHPIQTAADVLAMIEQADLPPVRKRDLVSAINRVCSMIGCPPTALRLEPTVLRAKLAAIRPAAHRIEPSTFANIGSLFAAALEWAGIIERFPRAAALRDPVWGPFAAAIAGDKRLSHGLASFMNWCAHGGINPQAVDDAVLQAFLHWLETRTIRPNVRRRVRETAKLWNEARAMVPDWPNRPLASISFRPASGNLAWNVLPPALRVEAEAYLALRAQPDVFDPDPEAPKRPLAPSTIRLQRDHIRLAVSVLVLTGKPVEELRGLADVIEVNAFKAVVAHYHKKRDAKPSSFAVSLASTLIDIARYSVRVPEEHLKELKRLASKLPAVPFDLTDKNKALLREFESDEKRARLFFLPEDLMRFVQAKLQEGRLLFVEAQIALAVAILLVAPLRPQNLTSLNFSRNFEEPQGPRGKLVLHIPKDDTKTKRRDLIFEFPPELAHPIRWYRREILPRLGGDPTGDLFISKGGTRKVQETVSHQLTEIIAERVGVRMTGHQFRHLAACLYLEAHPEDYRSVTDLLGHAWQKTTSIYAGSSTRRASRVYGDHVLEQRRQLELRQRKRKATRVPIAASGGRRPQ